jgi:hypothetical protein
MQAKARVCNPWREARNPELAGYTGHIFEMEVLGGCKVRIIRGHVKFNKLVKQVRWAQPGDPYRPQGESANFHRAVADELESRGVKGSALGIFSAIGTPLDYQGIDGFFSFEGIMISVDCTLDQNADPSPRARVVVRGEDMLDGYKEPAYQIANLICEARRKGRKGMV